MSKYELPNVLDSLNPSDYKTPAAYYEAAADLAMKRDSDEFRSAYSRVTREAQQREEKVAAEARRKEQEKLISEARLSPGDHEAIERRVQDEIAAEIKSGALEPSKMNEEFAKRTEKAVRAQKERMAINKQIRLHWNNG